MASHLFRISDGFHFISGDDDLGSRGRTDAPNPHHQFKELAQVWISFNECADGFFNRLAILLQGD